MGPTAALVDAGSRRPAVVARAVRGRPGIVDVVVGADSVLVVAGSPGALEAAVAAAAAVVDDGAGGPPGGLVEIPVAYDGPDLGAVADATGMTEAQVVALHQAGDYEVAFVGFAPGFGYLRGLPDALRLPRREAPRDRVPPGAVAIADAYSAVYPRATPGGWHLLGTTDMVLFDPDREPAAVLTPGTRVRFVATVAPAGAAPEASGAPSGARRDPPRIASDPNGPVADHPDARVGAVRSGGRDVLAVSAPGALTTVQDRGRPGFAAEGVPPSGAFDPAAAALANRLVGNDEGAAVLESTLAGPVLRLDAGAPRTVAITGPPGPVTVAGTPEATSAPFELQPGAVVEIGAPVVGLRRYVAVSGGIVGGAVLRSASTDLLTGLGPPVLRAGDRLELGTDPRRRSAVGVAPVPLRPGRAELAVTPGPHHDVLTAEGAATLGASGWVVAASSNRIGVRLDGPRLERAGSGEIPPVGLVTGAVQLTPSGQLVAFGPDHPVTGGYPVIAVVDPADVALLAQLRPGEEVRLRAR